MPLRASPSRSFSKTKKIPIDCQEGFLTRVVLRGMRLRPFCEEIRSQFLLFIRAETGGPSSPVIAFITF